MKKLVAIWLCMISLFAFGQKSDSILSKNIFRFQFSQSLGHAQRRPIKMNGDKESKIYLAPFSFVMDIGYARKVSRKVSVGVDYSFGIGRMAMAFADQTKKDLVPGEYPIPDQIPLEDPVYHNHGFVFHSTLNFSDLKNRGLYVRCGLGFSLNTVNQVVNLGRLTSFVWPEQFYGGHPRWPQPVEILGQRRIKSTRPFFNVLIAGGKNWQISKKVIFNLEIASKLNFAIDGKNPSEFPWHNLSVKNLKKWQGNLLDRNNADVDRNLYMTKARQEILTINFGLKFVL